MQYALVNTKKLFPHLSKLFNNTACPVIDQYFVLFHILVAQKC